jgi:hypothetical protein
MIDIPTIVSTFNAATSGIKNAVEIVKRLRGSPSLTPAEVELVEVAGERMSAADKALLDFKDRAFALQEENAQLKDRIVKLGKFHAGKKRLKLCEIAPGAFAFISKKAMPPFSGVAWYCQHCLEKDTKSAFQLEKRDFHVDTYYCPACSAKIKVPNDLRAEVITVPRSRGGRGDW